MTVRLFSIPLSSMSSSELQAFHAEARRRYETFASRGVALNLTRGKPSARQLDLSNDLLALPGTADYRAGSIDCRNYGDPQGLPELRELFAPIFGITADRVILGNNASLSLMHDAIIFALLKGTCDGERPWSKEP